MQRELDICHIGKNPLCLMLDKCNCITNKLPRFEVWSRDSAEGKSVQRGMVGGSARTSLASLSITCQVSSSSCIHSHRIFLEHVTMPLRVVSCYCSPDLRTENSASHPHLSWFKRQVHAARNPTQCWFPANGTVEGLEDSLLVPVQMLSDVLETSWTLVPASRIWEPSGPAA